MRYKYLIAYLHDNGIGRCFLNSDTPLDTEDRIIDAEKSIQESQSDPNITGISVTNFTALRG